VKTKNLNIVFLEGRHPNEVVKDPSAIARILNEQAREALWLKGRPEDLHGTPLPSVVSQRFVKQMSATGRTRLQGGHADAMWPTVAAVPRDGGGGLGAGELGTPSDDGPSVGYARADCAARRSRGVEHRDRAA